MEITLNFVSGHSICHMVIKNDDQSVVKKDILNEDVANVFSGLSTTDEIYAVPQFLRNRTLTDMWMGCYTDAGEIIISPASFLFLEECNT